MNFHGSWDRGCVFDFMILKEKSIFFTLPIPVSLLETYLWCKGPLFSNAHRQVQMDHYVVILSLSSSVVRKLVVWSQTDMSEFWQHLDATERARFKRKQSALSQLQVLNSAGKLLALLSVTAKVILCFFPKRTQTSCALIALTKHHSLHCIDKGKEEIFCKINQTNCQKKQSWSFQSRFFLHSAPQQYNNTNANLGTNSLQNGEKWTCLLWMHSVRDKTFPCHRNWLSMKMKSLQINTALHLNSLWLIPQNESQVSPDRRLDFACRKPMLTLWEGMREDRKVYLAEVIVFGNVIKRSIKSMGTAGQFPSFHCLPQSTHFAHNNGGVPRTLDLYVERKQPWILNFQ